MVAPLSSAAMLATKAAAGDQGRLLLVVIAPGAGVDRVEGAAEFAHGDHQCGVEQAALFEVFDEGG